MDLPAGNQTLEGCRIPARGKRAGLERGNSLHDSIEWKLELGIRKQSSFVTIESSPIKDFGD
jgi:hypothetical protein